MTLQEVLAPFRIVLAVTRAADDWSRHASGKPVNQSSKSAHMRKESIVNEVMVQREGFAGSCQKVLQVAKQLYQSKPDWVTFFRETLGVNGAARSVFSSQEEYVKFEQSEEFAEIQKMVAGLRTRKAGGGKNEPTRVITVRLPESLHEALKAEASDHNTSMNKLCISKLLQVLIEEEKATQAAATATRSSAIPTNPAPTPSPAASPAQSPSFRSTYGQPAPNMNQPRRFGQ
jgi:predicted HicB family RNase H-like nuclease